MDVLDSAGEQRSGAATMSSMKERFVARLQHNLESWRAGEIDYAMFNECNRETWRAILEAGKDIEAEVVAAMHAVPLLAAGSPKPEGIQAAMYRARRHRDSWFSTRPYRGNLERTAKGPILWISAIAPARYEAEHRSVAAAVYEVAADMERRSEPLEAHWTISPDPQNGRVAVELAGTHEAELADEFVANIMLQHHLF